MPFEPTSRPIRPLVLVTVPPLVTLSIAGAGNADGEDAVVRPHGAGTIDVAVPSPLLRRLDHRCNSWPVTVFDIQPPDAIIADERIGAVDELRVGAVDDDDADSAASRHSADDLL